MEQRSPDWHKARLGRFTASEISKLLGVKGLGKTGESYIMEKAREAVFGVDDSEDFTTFDMQRGIDLEPIAFAKFKELKALDFIEVEETTFFSYGETAGASPDGLVGKDAILEIKCPKPGKFFKLVALGVGEIDSVYIDQMQMQMLCTNSVRAHFFNFIVFKNNPLWHEFIIERDEVRISLIKQRITEATRLRDGYIDLLNKNKQF